MSVNAETEAGRAERIAREMLQDVVDGADPGWSREDILMGLGWALLLTARATRELQPDDVELVDDTVMTVMGLLLDDCSNCAEGGMSEIDAALYRQHVVPLHDLREHEPTLDCWCGPVVDADGVVTHHPIDPQGRAALQGDDGATARQSDVGMG